MCLTQANRFISVKDNQTYSGHPKHIFHQKSEVQLFFRIQNLIHKNIERSENN